MANQIEYGLKFNTQDMEKLIKLAEKLDKQSKLVVKDFQSGERKKTDSFDSELKKREQQLKKSKAWEKQLRNIDLANEKKMQEEITRNQKEEMRKREQAAKQSQRNQSQGVAKGGSGSYGAFSPVTRVAKYIATATVLYGGMSAFRKGRDAIVEYEAALGNLRAALGDATEADIKMMGSFAHSEHIIQKYGMSATETANAMVILAKAGLNTNEVMTMLEPSLALAAAGQIEVAEASESLIKILAGAGLDKKQAGTIADYLAQIDVKSITNIQELTDALKIAAPAGKRFGQSIEETISMLGAMSKAGLKGASAGNAYERVLNRLTKRQKEVVDGLKKYNIKLYLDKDGKATSEVTNKLRKYSDIMSDIQKSGLLKNFADAQSIMGQYALKSAGQIATTVPEVNNLKKSLEDANGVANQMAEIKMDTLAGELTKLKSKWDNLFTGRDGIAATLKDATFSLNQWFTIFNEWLNLGKDKSVLSWYADIFREANKEIEKSQKLLGQIQDPSLKSGVGDEVKRKRRIDFVLGFTDKELEDKIKTYKKNIGIFNKVVSDKESDIAKNPSVALPFTDSATQSIKSRKAMRTIGQDKRVLAEQRQYLAIAEAIYKQRKKNAEISTKDTKVPSPTGGTGNGKGTPKEHYANLDAWLMKMLKLSDDYREKEFNNVDKDSKELNNKYDELYLELKNSKWKSGEDILALDALEKANLLGNTEMIADLIILAQKKAQEEEIKNMEYASGVRQKIIEDDYEKRVKSIEDFAEREKEVREKYQGLGGKLSDLKDQQALELEAAGSNKELMLNIKKEYAEQAVQLAYETWQKENQIANGVMDSIGSAYSTLAQTMTDMDMTGKDRREAIWESFRSTAITTLTDIIGKMIMAKVVSTVFGDAVKQSTPDPAAATAGYGASIAGAIGLGITAAAVTPALTAMGVALGAATFGANYIAAGVAKAAYEQIGSGVASGLSNNQNIGMFSSKSPFKGGGFSVNDAVVSDGKVYPYRKDDLVFLGTGLGSKSGATLPDKALPNGSGNSNGNASLVNELRALRLAVARSDANNVKAIASNTPIIQGTMMDNVKIYKASKIGEKQSNFIVSPK